METVSELGLGEDEAGDEVAEEAEAADDGDEEITRRCSLFIR